MIRHVAAMLLCVLALGGTATAQDLAKGKAAYKAQDYKAALKELKPLAEAGNAEAQLYYSRILGGGWGVSANVPLSLKWLHKAVAQGLAEAQYELGLYHHNKDEWHKAAKMHRAAAEQNHCAAQHFLGKAYEEGQGAPQDYVLAYMWYNLAAAQTGPWCDSLSRLYRDNMADKLFAPMILEAQKLSRECVAKNYKGC